MTTDKASVAAPRSPVASMTGFAAVDRDTPCGRVRWELKSVNGRGLEFRFRTPPGYDAVEQECRQRAAAVLARGSVSAALSMDTGDSRPGVSVHEPTLRVVLDAVASVAARIDCAPPRAEAILSLRGVLREDDGLTPSVDAAAAQEAIAEVFMEALDDLLAGRCGEGAKLKAACLDGLQTIETLIAGARKAAPGSAETLRARLANQLASLKEQIGVSEERLAQEAALLTVKADVQEELDRLDAHIDAARALFATGGPIGRKLDFLAQEFNREANTLCAKAPDMQLKSIGLELKSVIDQLREQVQNIE